MGGHERRGRWVNAVTKIGGLTRHFDPMRRPAGPFARGGRDGAPVGRC